MKLLCLCGAAGTGLSFFGRCSHLFLLGRRAYKSCSLFDFGLIDCAGANIWFVTEWGMLVDQATAWTGSYLIWFGYVQIFGLAQDEGLLVDKAIPHVAACWNRFLAELTGLAKLPMLLIFLFFGKLFLFFFSQKLRRKTRVDWYADSVKCVLCAAQLLVLLFV